MTTSTIENGHALAPAKRTTVMGSLAERYSMDPVKLLDTIKATCIKGHATNEQVQAFLIVANRYGLDPFLKQIHAFAGQGGGIVPIVGIDGWTKTVNDQNEYDGCQFQEWRSEQEYHVWQQMRQAKDDGDMELLSELRKLYVDIVRQLPAGAEPVAITCRMFSKDRSKPVEATEWLSECKRNTPAWNQMKRRMLRHKAFMQAGRIAFGIGGIYDEDEARDIMHNEAPAPVIGGAKTLADKFAPKPPDPDQQGEAKDEQTVEPIDGEVVDPPAGSVAEAEHSDAKNVAADVEIPDVSTWDKFHDWFARYVIGELKIDPTKANEVLGELKMTKCGSARHRDAEARRAVASAIIAGTFDFDKPEVPA